MAVVLLAMGGYGAYLGWKIRLAGGKDGAEGEADDVISARRQHPLLMGLMFFFFVLGESVHIGTHSLYRLKHPVVRLTSGRYACQYLKVEY